MKEFMNEYVIPNKPVVLLDAAKGWKALDLFTPQFFKEKFPDKVAEARGKKIRLADYMDMMVNSTEQNPAPYPYKFDIEAKFTELIEYIEPRFDILKKNRLKSPLFKGRLIPKASTLEIFFGGPGGWFPYLHYDLYGLYAIVTQVYGRKEFTLYDPSDAQYMYINPEDPWMSTIENYHNPDYNKYPLFAKATASKVVISPGETVFVPLGWWHTAKSLEPTISIANDLLAGTNWQKFREDVVFYVKKNSKLKASIVDLYIRGIGMAMSVHEKFVTAY